MKKILLVASTHGHERIGLRVFEGLSEQFDNLPGVDMIVANPEATKKGVPYLDDDLNRIFPGKPDGSYEEQRAFELSKRIEDYDVVIDMHSTKTTDLGTDSMLIATKYDKATKELVEHICPPKVLVMGYKSDRALISSATVGLAFEYGRDDSEGVLSATLFDIAQILMHTGNISTNPFEQVRCCTHSQVYQVYDAFTKNFNGSYTLQPDIANFHLCRMGQLVCQTESGQEIRADEDFYPILFGNNRYQNILGFKARIVD